MTNTPAWISSHVYGDSLSNHHRQLLYVNIPKCASMWMRLYISMLGDTFENTWTGTNFVIDDYSNYTALILLRDPVQRWISNCPAPEHIIDMANDPRSINNMFDDFDDWTKDEHSSLQTNFITGLNLEKAVFFYCDKHLSSNVNHYFNSHGFNVDAPAPINERPAIYNEACNSWNKILTTPEYFTKFKNYFKKDYDLINSVAFYRLGELENATR